MTTAHAILMHIFLPLSRGVLQKAHEKGPPEL
jgi:hypothetical protein